MAELFEFQSRSEDDTLNLGRHLANALQPGIAVALNGDLGAGKTNLVRAVCQSLGIDDGLVNSPTFVLMQSYAGGRIPVVHFDTYRLSDVDEFLSIGGEDYLLDPSIICFVEWAERIAEVMPSDCLTISIEHSGATSRSIRFAAGGCKSEMILKTLVESLPNR